MSMQIFHHAIVFSVESFTQLLFKSSYINQEMLPLYVSGLSTSEKFVVLIVSIFPNLSTQ